MWPSDILPTLRDHPMRERARRLVCALHSDDSFEFDFDMLICKYPQTNTATPAHQDQAYWIELPDKRAVSIWIALDESTIDNGCVWVYGYCIVMTRKHFMHGQHTTAHFQYPGTSGSTVACRAYTKMPIQSEQHMFALTMHAFWRLLLSYHTFELQY